MDDYIRVSARVRAMRSAGEKVIFANEANNVVAFRLNNDEKFFSFDHVFPELTSQECVFTQVGKRIIDGCLAGYNGTIFAYGQTSSGKTYTMFGAHNEDGTFKKNLQGIIPRSMDYLFDTLSLKRQEDPNSFSFVVTCSFVQLYNEAIYDLLDNINSKLRIRTDAKNQVYVEGAVVETIQSSDEVMELLRVGFRNRRVAETAMNRESSRSHAIFIVEVSTQHSANGLINFKSARLNLVDLAGSERQSDTQTIGSNLKEASCINKSLSILTRVIRNLSKNAKQYPGYRDSQLTRLLQDSLGGNAKASVIVNLHPNIEYADTTASTLLFSETVKKIKNKAIINENLAGENIDALRKEILRLKEENEMLKANSVRVVELENEIEDIRNELSKKEEEFGQLELNQSILAHKETLREALDESLRHNKSLNVSVQLFDDVDERMEEVVKDFQSDELNELIKKLSESEQHTSILEKRLAKAEKLNENYKVILAKRDESIVQFEGDLSYKSRRVENLREVLEEVQQKLNSLEEENETLKIDIVKLHKEKTEHEKFFDKENQIYSGLKVQIEELQRQRDDALKDLSGLTGHVNAKQKINYLNKLRERISSLENENAELKSSANNTSTISSRLRPALRSRGNSQPSLPRCSSNSSLGGGASNKSKRNDP